MRISDWSSDVCSSDLVLAAKSTFTAVTPATHFIALRTVIGQVAQVMFLTANVVCRCALAVAAGRSCAELQRARATPPQVIARTVSSRSNVLLQGLSFQYNQDIHYTIATH